MPRIRYAEIAQEMIRLIESGEWPEGETIPSEPQLAQRFGVTRDTVRRALDALRTDGILDTARGVGSWVRSRAPRRYLGPNRYDPLVDRGAGSALFRVGEEHAPTSGQTRSEVWDIPARLLPDKIRDWLRVSGETPVLQREAEFRADGHGQQMWTSWVPLEVVEGTALADPAVDPWAGATEGLYEAMGYRHRRDELIEHVWTRPADARESRFLNIPQGAAVLVVERVMYFEREGGPGPLPLEAAVVVLPGERVVLINRFCDR